MKVQNASVQISLREWLLSKNGIKEMKNVKDKFT